MPYFFIAWLAAFLYPVVRYTSLVRRPDLWAEQGTNYLVTVMNLPLSQGIWVPDAGYLVLFPRLVSYLIYAIFPLKFFPIATSVFGIAVIAFFAAFFNLHAYRSIISSDAVRFVITLLFGLVLFPSFEVYTYINFSYYGILLCFLLIFYDKTRMHRGVYVTLSLLAALLCASKFHFELFLPIYLVLAVWQARKHAWREAIFYLPAIVLMIVQLVNVAHVLKTDGMHYTVATNGSVSIFTHFLNGILTYIQIYANGRPLSVAVVFCIIIWLAFWQMMRKGILTRRQAAFVILANVVAIGFSMISAQRSEIVGILPPRHVGTSRSYIIQTIVVGCTMLWTCGCIFKHREFLSGYRRYAVGLLVAVFCFYPLRVSIQEAGDYPLRMKTAWNEYYQLMERDSYFIPIYPQIDANPLKRFSLMHNCKNLQELQGRTESEIDIRDAIKDAQELQVVYLHVQQPGKVLVHAVDDDGNLLEEGQMISLPEDSLKYILFDHPMKPARLKITDENGAALAGPYEMFLIGE